MTPPTDHVSTTEFEAFVGGDVDATRKREILGHLLGRCAACQEVARTFWATSGSGQAVGGEASSDAAHAELEATLERAALRADEQHRRLITERDRAPSLAEVLDSHPPLRRRLLIENRRQYQTWALCEHLLHAGHELRFSDPKRYEELAESATWVSRTLDSATYGERLVRDMRGRALAYLANAKRVHTSDLQEVERLLGLAKAELAEGTGDPLELHRVLSFERALRMRQQRYEEALELCNRLLNLARSVNDRPLVGKTLQNRGLALRNLERFEEALDSFALAERHLDPDEDLRSLSAVRLNTIGTLDDLGRRHEALERVEPLREILEQLGDRLSLLRLRAMEGEFALTIRDYELAEECFREARNGFVSLDVGWEAAEVSLYLAQVFLLTGRTRETKELAEQILPIFRSAALTTEAIAAILLFREALLSETATLQLVQNTLSLLEGEQRKPASRQ